MIEAIDAVAQDNFSEFSKKVKISLDDKLRNSSFIKTNSEKQREMEKIKNIFSKIEIKNSNL